MRLPRYVYYHERLTLRSALPDRHPESWPSKYREANDEEIPEGWRDLLRVPSKEV